MDRDTYLRNYYKEKDAAAAKAHEDPAVILPVKAAGDQKVDVLRQYIAMGISPLGVPEGGKVRVELPEGWTVEEGTFKKLLDDKGRMRARYILDEHGDRSFIIFFCRYGYDMRPFDNYENETVTHAQRRFEKWFGVILDCGQIIASTNPYTPQTLKEYEEVMPEVLSELCEKYLQEHYPNYKDFNAYWD